MDRNWRIPEDEPIGTRVAHAKTFDQGELSFTIQPSDHNDFSQFFRIDQKTGAIFLNQHLKGRVRPLLSIIYILLLII